MLIRILTAKRTWFVPVEAVDVTHEDFVNKKIGFM